MLCELYLNKTVIKLERAFKNPNTKHMIYLKEKQNSYFKLAWNSIIHNLVISMVYILKYSNPIDIRKRGGGSLTHPLFTFVKSNATCLYETAFSLRYLLYRLINVDMSYPVRKQIENVSINY